MLHRWNCCCADISSMFQRGEPTVGWWTGEWGLPIMSMGLVLLSKGLLPCNKKKHSNFDLKFDFRVISRNNITQVLNQGSVERALVASVICFNVATENRSKRSFSSKFTYTVKPKYKYHPRDVKIVAVVDRWSLFRDHFYHTYSKWNPKR